MMMLMTYLLLTIIFSHHHASCKRIKISPEVYLNIEQRIKSHGYPVETHQVSTEDDYLLTLYHIPHGLKGPPQNETKNSTKSPVLLIHGMGGSPENFVVLGRNWSLPYYLTERGLDAWLFSARGVSGAFKQRHKKYDWDKDDNYWKFSLHEIGVYDVAASIDYILNYTGEKKLSLIGHSAGGNEFFSMFSDRPEYNEKVKVAISWGSAPILKRSDYPLMILLAALGDIWKGLVKIGGTSEFAPFLQTFKPVIRAMCADSDWRKACIAITGVIGSHKSLTQRPEDIDVIVSNLPRLSGQQIFHFMDNFNNGTFRKFDYGPKKNMRLYGQEHPPHYNLSAATAPTAFFLGPSDDIIMLEDIYEAVEQIPNTVMIYRIPYAKFTHTDFVMSRNATSLLYEPTYKLIKDIDDGVVFPPIKPPKRTNNNNL